jgi:hypothetical protein
MTTTRRVAPWVRVTILVVFAVGIIGLAILITGSAIPENSSDQVVFLNGLLLVVLSSELIEYKFTKPADAATNSLLGSITLVALYESPYPWGLFLILGYCLAVTLISFTCIAVSSSERLDGWRRTVSDITYPPSVYFGNAVRLYSVVFLYAAVRAYGLNSWEVVALTSYWGLYVSLDPLNIPHLITKGVAGRRRLGSVIGKVIRTESPDLIRVNLRPSEDWSRDALKLYHRADGEQLWVLPLYSQVQGDTRIGTGLMIGLAENTEAAYVSGHVSSVSLHDDDHQALIKDNLGSDEDSRLAGFVIEGSSISKIKFEIWNPSICREGMLVWSRCNGKKVYYQITEGVNYEEVLQDGRHGYQIGHAVQLGYLANRNNVGEENTEHLDGNRQPRRRPSDNIFLRNEWLPPMNTAVFAEDESHGDELELLNDVQFRYGYIPGSSLEVGGDLVENLGHHAAILGVTGSGKTELTLDIVRHTQAKGVKVICIDLTGQYTGKLNTQNPTDLSVSGDEAENLNQLLFDVETGEYGAAEEKRALKEFSEELRGTIEEHVRRFIEDDPTNIGLIELREVSNTKATLRLTEMYLTSILHYARDHETHPQILIVVEEAHTVIPETNTIGSGGWDTKALVNKIAQVALQGRKYDIGLLVVTQRTATVSKSVLTQCNTIVSFACQDDTSLRFLKNVFGEDYTEMVSNLQPLQAIVAGKGVASGRPIRVQIPYDAEKVDE